MPDTQTGIEEEKAQVALRIRAVPKSVQGLPKPFSNSPETAGSPPAGEGAVTMRKGARRSWHWRQGEETRARGQNAAKHAIQLWQIE